MEIIKVPTGEIVLIDGDLGQKLECLSLGDYGKEKNIKADFLGITRKLDGVPHGDLLSLEEKWVVTISSQYGCSQKCLFCDVPKVGPGLNATFNDLIKQVGVCLDIHPEIKTTKRLNLHYARMGEPTYNSNVLLSAYYLTGLFREKRWGFHPVVSTMMPNRLNIKILNKFLNDWMIFKNEIKDGNAGLQLSINSTSEKHRIKMFQGCSLSLDMISDMINTVLSSSGLKGRKITLNFALTNDPIDAEKLKSLFDPKHFLVKITPMHKTTSCENNKIETKNGYISYYPYQTAEDSLKNAGFDVIVFIPSKEEDEGRITCGNALLSGSKPLNTSMGI